jgi:hypothetical protein
MKQVAGRHGEVLLVAAAKAKDARRIDVRWLTPRAFRRYMQVGLCGHDAGWLPAGGWAGCLQDHNVAFVDLLYSAGMRLSEGARRHLSAGYRRRLAQRPRHRFGEFALPVSSFLCLPASHPTGPLWPR